MASGTYIKSDLLQIYNYVQLTNIMAPKLLVIEQLREFFSQDSYYVYRRDAWGFNLQTDLTDKPSDAGLNDNSTTRIFIGEKYKYDTVFYPAIIVSSGGSKAVPISFNREREAIQWKGVQYMDGYGNVTIKHEPSHKVFSGASEGSINIEVLTRSLRARDELADLIWILFVDKAISDLQRSGVAIKPNGVSVSAPSETDDRNDKLFKLTVSIDYRSEWRRHIPVENVVDLINICVEFGHNIDTDNPQIAPNLTVSTDIDLIQQLQNI